MANRRSSFILVCFICLGHGIAESIRMSRKSARNNKTPFRVDDGQLGEPHTLYRNNQAHGVRTFNFKYADCGDYKALIEFKHIILQPDPLVLPGNIYIGFDISTYKELVSPFGVNLTMSVNAGGGWVQIPCVDGLGSCFYGDICDAVAFGDCPTFLTDRGFQCNCPFAWGEHILPATTVTMDGSTIPLPPTLASGLYQIEGHFYQNNSQVGCLKVQLRLEMH